MDILFIVRKVKELKLSNTKILRTAFSLEKVSAVLKGSGKRNCIYKPMITWGIWLAQTLFPDKTCRNALAYARSAGLVPKKASVHTGGYCHARSRLKEDVLHNLAVDFGVELSRAEQPEDRWHSRRVIVADGSSVSLPDTRANQKVYPQPNTQAIGCGFPVMYLGTLMSLSSGALLDFATGAGNGNELTLYRQLGHHLQPGDVLLGDGKYSAYTDVAELKQRGIDTVARIGSRKTDFRKGKIIALKDHLVEWERPKQLPERLEGKSIPEKMTIRELRYRVETPGSRTQTVTIVTTLLDAEIYLKEDIAELFFCRWQIELRLRDIKTMLNMDMLRTKTPERVHKELWMYLTAYNLLRTLMWESASKAGEVIKRISFQGCRQRFLAIAVQPCSAHHFPLVYNRFLNELAQDLNPNRPHRVEPRAIKRRKKQYDLLNQPREILKKKLMKMGA